MYSLQLLFLFVCYFVWYRVSLCNPHWSGTWDPPASASHLLGLQKCIITLSYKHTFNASEIYSNIKTHYKPESQYVQTLLQYLTVHCAYLSMVKTISLASALGFATLVIWNFTTNDHIDWKLRKTCYYLIACGIHFLFHWVHMQMNLPYQML
jgi:hypothetical protein